MPTHKDFYDAVSNTSIKADTINLNVDTVETKLDTATGLLTTLSADTALIKTDMANGVGVTAALYGESWEEQLALKADIYQYNGEAYGALVVAGQTYTNFANIPPIHIAGTVTVGSALPAGTNIIGSVYLAKCTTPTVISFTSLTSATLIASNASRKMLTIQNTGAGILYVLFGSGTASSTNFSVQMNSGDFYENDYYSGQMNAIFATAGTAYVTSLT